MVTTTLSLSDATSASFLYMNIKSICFPVVFADSTDRATSAKKKAAPINSENIVYNTNVQLIQRRGSMPCESLTVLSRNGCNASKNRSSRKKLLRRRSSGGADLLVPTIGEAADHHQHESEYGGGQSSQTPSSTSWFRFKREIARNRSELDSFMSRRRGSLPVEMQGVTHSGEFCVVFYCIC